MSSWQQIEAGELVAVALCLLLSAYFSGAETALTALSEAKAKQLSETGTRLGRYLKLWLDKPHRVLTAILIGNRAANVAVAFIAALVADRVFDNLLLDVVVALIAIAVLVFGEITPRSFAKHNAATLAPLFMPGVYATYYLTLPLVVLFTRYSHLVVRLSGGTVTRSGPFVTEDDIVSMIRLGRKEGVLDKTEGRMLVSIFELGATLVREVMVPRTEISALPITASYDDVMREVREQGHSRLPVFDETLDEVKGFFHTKDLLHTVAEKTPFKLKEHLRPVLFVPEVMRTSDLLKLFQRKKTHLAVVVDEYGGTAGIVALEDVLEEIVGPIQDEHDEDDVPFRKIDDMHFTAEGRAGLYELGEALAAPFPMDGGYETLGGFLIARCGRMPRRGDRVLFSSWLFVVKDADEKRVARIEIERQVSSVSTPPMSAQQASDAAVVDVRPTTDPTQMDAVGAPSAMDEPEPTPETTPARPRIVKSA